MAADAELEVEKVMSVLMKYLTPEESISPWEPVAPGPWGRWPGFPLSSLLCALRSMIETSAERRPAVSRLSSERTTILLMIGRLLLDIFAAECRANSYFKGTRL